MGIMGPLKRIIEVVTDEKPWTQVLTRLRYFRTRPQVTTYIAMIVGAGHFFQLIVCSHFTVELLG